MRRTLFFLLLLLIPTVAAQETEVDVDTQTGTAYGLEWNPDGTILAVASGYEITLYSADLQEVLAVSDIEDAVALDIAWNPDGTRMASVSGYNNAQVRIWQWDEQARTLTLENTLDGFTGVDRRLRTRHQYAVTWHEDTLVTLADDRQGKFQVWDVATGEVVALWETNYSIPLREFIWNEDGTEVITAGMDAEETYVLYSLNLTSGETAPLFPIDGQSYIFTLSPDRQWIAIGYEDGNIDIRDFEQSLMEFEAVAQPVALAWYADTLAVLGYDTTLQLWDVSALQE